jgi:hypothetical protein
MLLLEVMDKMPPAARVLAVGLAVGVVGFALVRRWRWAVLGVLPLAGVVAWSSAAIYTDPHVGPAVWREGGWLYALPVALSALLAIALPLVGLLAGRSPGHRRAGAA